MLRSTLQQSLCWMGVLLVLLTGCGASFANSSQVADAVSRPETLLKPGASIPSSCPATPVYAGGQYAQYHPDLPWVEATPASSGIVAFLSYAGNENGVYRLPPKNGVYTSEGLYTKTFWIIENAQAQYELKIDGVQLTDLTNTFHDTGNAISDSLPLPPDGRKYTSYISAPSAGCWQLVITSGGVRGSIVMWVVE